MADEVKVAHPTNYLETLMHLLKGSIGTGLFAMGDGFKNTGLLLGIFLMGFLGLICTYANHQLITAALQLQETLNLKEQPDFPGTVELVFTTGPEKVQKFGPAMKRFTEIFICLTQLGFCCVYIVFAASTFEQVLAYFGHTVDIHILMAIVIIPILLTCLIRNLKYLTPVSMTANIFLLAGTIACLYFAVQDVPPMSERNLIADWRRIPLFFGTALFALEIIGLVMPLRAEMANPLSFEKPFGVLNTGSFFFVTLYIIMGFLCYLKWGESIRGSVTLELDETQILPQLIKIATGFAIMFTYAIQFYVPFVILWPGMINRFGPFNRPIVTELAFRTTIVLFTFILAEAIPFLSLLISLVGALSSSALALMLPPILEYVMCWKISAVTPWIIIKNFVIFFVGILGTITGTYVSIYSIVEAFRDQITSYDDPDAILSNLFHKPDIV